MQTAGCRADSWLPPPVGDAQGLLSLWTRRDGHRPPLTIFGDKLGGDSCLKCGKNRAVVTCHDVAGAACRGGKPFLSREGESLLVNPGMADPRWKSLALMEASRGFALVFPLTSHNHAQKSQ